MPLLVGARSRGALRRRSRGGCSAIGYAFGVVFFGLGTHWIALLSDVASTQPWIKYPAWLAGRRSTSRCSRASTTLLAGWLARRVPLAFVFPPALVVIEELRGSGELGLSVVPARLHAARLCPGGAAREPRRRHAGDAVAGFVNVLIWRALARPERALRAALGALLALALPWLWGWRTLEAVPRAAGPRVALVQGNIPGEIKWSGTHQPEILSTFLDLTERAADSTPGDRDLARDRDRQLSAAGSPSRRRRCWNARAAPACRSSAATRISIVQSRRTPAQLQRRGTVSADGSTGPRYAKRHLVPFGERMPFERLFPALGRLDLGQAEWTPGDRVVLFPSAAGPFACLICFESIFPDLSRESVRAGAQLAREHHQRRVVRQQRRDRAARGDGGVSRRRESRAAGALREHRAHRC